MEEENIIIVPMVALRGINVFPKMLVHFDAKREQSVRALEKAMDGDQRVFLVAQTNANDEKIDPDENLYDWGTLALIKQIVKLPGNVVRVLVEGQERAELVEVHQDKDYLEGGIRLVPNQVVEIEPMEKEALLRTAVEVILDYNQVNAKVSQEVLNSLLAIGDMGLLADSIATHLIRPMESKQSILEELYPLVRLKLAIRILINEMEIEKIQKDLHQEVKKKIDKSQKEYYLREQMKVIQHELGEGVDFNEEIEEFRLKAMELDAPEEVKERLQKEIKRLQKMAPGSAEGSVIRNYIEALLDLPWNVKTQESMDLKRAARILDEDHYGLEKVKERIVEHLAVRKLSRNTNTPIVCLVGPPGTGKTSIAKSIASALQRNYVRISLGGVRDEAEIRGHRKTYIGAMPGRFINALKQAGSSNPLLLLDEIDKMSSDMRGDPSAALLEVLDGEQNSKFRDHFIELPVDLSDVLFIATANSLRSIPRPLLDRLEIIEISSYTENEKLHIAKGHLVRKQMEKHGLAPGQLRISPKAMSKIINEYTREAGVRDLERRIGELCRKAAKEVMLDEKAKVQVTEKNLKSLLGTPRYRYDKISQTPQVGVARGLAWTEVGGDTLSIEVNVMPGKGQFEITGQIGDVMRESAKAALSYIRSRGAQLGLDPDFYSKKDIHIHIPEGAVPKDGPSAGITLATAVISAFLEKPVDPQVAMTGEITLRGRVLPIGGLKEKILAAKRAGIRKVLVPIDNKRNVEEIAGEVKEGIEIVFVSSMDEVLKETLS
ncbi:endopeptidase La [Anaerotalea alkaliphila]|uniref:Lon protease n=1 Tax=Anaerotalea alkaliphila TaxID=2662126 RepID=A0A7X5HTX7_9FIRM|nr:endopeptidase La [Anaerotalea alkaliphila]NDL66490.1 endopeptidase La [Anaerotalea alkaliphila]